MTVRTPGPWPLEFTLTPDGRVAQGLVVWSLSGEIEGRTTGGRTPCISDCDGWFIGVKWETGQQMHICSKVWVYDPDTRSIRVVDGGELSARFTDEHVPTPRSQWPDRSALGPAWRVQP